MLWSHRCHMVQRDPSPLGISSSQTAESEVIKMVIRSLHQGVSRSLPGTAADNNVAPARRASGLRRDARTRPLGRLEQSGVAEERTQALGTERGECLERRAPMPPQAPHTRSPRARNDHSPRAGPSARTPRRAPQESMQR